MDQREEIKEKIDLVELVGQYTELKKAGRNFKANCPFHKEKTPSFIVSPERQIFKCFGCNVGGDHFAFLMRMENMDFVEALQELAKRAGVKLKNYRLGDEEKKKQLIAQIPAGRLGEPKDIAGLVVYLASEWGDFICGQSILVDGGRTLFG